MQRETWQIERDRFGVMFSGPLEVGECIEVVVAPCGLCGGFGALNEVTRKPVPCMACGKESTGAVVVYMGLADQDEPARPQRGGLRLVSGSLAPRESQLDRKDV